jgi:hypothetical protein
MADESGNAPPKENGEDEELRAIGVILKALADLDGVSIQRVLDYVLGRLSIAKSRTPSAISFTASGGGGGSPLIPSDNETGSSFSPPRGQGYGGRVPSIRDLKEEKKPTSSNQMAAIVAYYLSEVAEGEDQKKAINSADIERYFKQAGFKLPASPPQTLPNAAAAGYFDSVGVGLYKLNPVGYNLVAHALPRADATSAYNNQKKKKKKSSK